MKRVTGKLGNMRKVVGWIVYSPSYTADGNKTLFVQSDKRAVSINVETGKGMLSNGKGHPGFHSTMKLMGAVEIDVPREFIDACLEGQAQKGDHIGGNVYVG